MSGLDDDDLPLTLEEACRDIFRDTIRPATLLAEAKRGRLVIERIGRRNFVTRAAIKEMREKCRVEPPRRASKEAEEAREDAERLKQSSLALDAALEAARVKHAALRKATAKASRARTGS